MTSPVSSTARVTNVPVGFDGILPTGVIMKKVLAVVFATVGFACQAFGSGCGYTADCPIDGNTAVKVRCDVNMKDFSESCLYEHQVPISGEYHRFWVTGCK